MKQLDTVQKMENLNDVFAIDEQGPGGAHHLYVVCKHSTARISEEDGTFRTRPENVLLSVQMQQGARKREGSIAGVIDSDLLEIVRDRLLGFQDGDFACYENAMALHHIECALMWLNRRVENRIARGVLGTEQS